MNQRGKLVAEFLLIVIGVLVALAVETALDSRQDDQLRDEYIARLKIDVAADKGAIENRIEQDIRQRALVKEFEAIVCPETAFQSA